MKYLKTFEELVVPANVKNAKDYKQGMKMIKKVKSRLKTKKDRKNLVKEIPTFK